MPTEHSVVIPAYNEAKRLPPYLESIRHYYDKHWLGTYEVVVVDDGSSDETLNVLAEFSKDWPALNVIEHSTNQGKGAAVRTGMSAARGDLVLFADADGATPICEEAKLAEAIAGGADVAVGSRFLAAPHVKRKRTWVRGIAGRAFATTARHLLHISIRDTQCGYKMFRRDAADRLFAVSKENGYLFDLELLAWASRFGLHVVEVPIQWADIPGGHLSLSREMGRVVTGLTRLRRRLARND